MERPNKASDEAIKEIAEEWVSNFKEAHGNRVMITINAVTDLTENIDRNGHQDGYELARMLEDSGWLIDFMMVEQLDYIGVSVAKEIEKAVKKWVESDNPEMKFKQGDSVKIVARGTTKIGVVIAARMKTATYLVHTEEQELGHNWLVNAENCNEPN